jgi:hypothetical protein
MEERAKQTPSIQPRRYERRYPQTVAEFSNFIPGYERTPQAASAMLNFLERQVTISDEMKKAILMQIG